MHPNAMLPLDLEKITAAIASGTRPESAYARPKHEVAHADIVRISAV